MAFVASIVFSLISGSLLLFLTNGTVRTELGGNYFLMASMTVSGFAVSILLASVTLLYLRKNILQFRNVIQQTALKDSPAERIEERDIGKLPSYLDDAEKDIFQVILDAGGSMLQKDLVSVRRYSKSKVTRALQRLEKLNFVDRMRHGSTNLIVARDERIGRKQK